LLCGPIDQSAAVHVRESREASSSGKEDRIAKLESEIENLRGEFASLRETFEEFRKQFE
jgi:uncharacterized protein YceH (UPF0502 family)